MQRAAGFGCRFNPKSGDERLECSVGGPATTLASWHESLLIGTINVGLPRDFNELRVAKISRFATSALTAGKQPLCCMDRADLCLSEETASISFYRAIAASLERLRSSRLLLPRSGLERSDFVLWRKADVPPIEAQGQERDI